MWYVRGGSIDVTGKCVKETNMLVVYSSYWKAEHWVYSSRLYPFSIQADMLQVSLDRRFHGLNELKRWICGGRELAIYIYIHMSPSRWDYILTCRVELLSPLPSPQDKWDMSKLFSGVCAWAMGLAEGGPGTRGRMAGRPGGRQAGRPVCPCMYLKVLKL